MGSLSSRPSQDAAGDEHSLYRFDDYGMLNYSESIMDWFPQNKFINHPTKLRDPHTYLAKSIDELSREEERIGQCFCCQDTHSSHHSSSKERTEDIREYYLFGEQNGMQHDLIETIMQYLHPSFSDLVKLTHISHEWNRAVHSYRIVKLLMDDAHRYHHSPQLEYHIKELTCWKRRYRLVEWERKMLYMWIRNEGPRMKRGGHISNQMRKTNRVDKYQVILIGESSIGKTSFVQRLQYRDDYPPNHSISSTIGVQHFRYDYNNNSEIVMWDCSGKSRFEFIIRSYLNEASLVVLMFDLTNEESLNQFTSDSGRFHSYVQKFQSDDISVLMIGLKKDLQVEHTMGKTALKFCQSNRIPYYECCSQGPKSRESCEIVQQMIGFYALQHSINKLTC